MSLSARPAVGFSITAIKPNGTIQALLVIAAMAAGFLWSSGHDDQRCVELGLLALLVPFIVMRCDAADTIAGMNPAARLCLGAFFAIGAISSLNAWSPAHAVYEWSMLLLLLLAAASLATGLGRAGGSGLMAVLQCAGAVGALYSLRVVLLYAASLSAGHQLDMQALGVGFSNIRFFNHVQTVLLPLIVLLHLQAPKRSVLRWAWFALAAFWWALLFVSEARASILALGAGCAMVLVVRRAHARSFLKAMALTALAGGIVYVLGFILLPMLAGLRPFDAASNVLQRTAADPTSRRSLLWLLSFDLIAAHPLLGAGPQHFAHYGATLSWGAHPHNFVLQIGAEWGLPALLCLLGAIGIGLRGLVRSGDRIAASDQGGQQILAVLLATGAAILVDGLFSGVVVMPESQMAIVLYLGWAAGWVRSLSNTAAPRSSATLRWLIAGLALAAAAGLALAVAPSIVGHALHEPLTPAELAVNPKTHWPRLWVAGYF
jgi:O-antigen ligase